MAFLRKAGSILGRTLSSRVNQETSVSNPSIMQAIRWMSSSKVFVGGLSYNTDETSLEETFAKYGQILDAKVVIDRESGRSRGFGFVTYSSAEEASAAIQALDQQVLDGRTVKVNYANERRGGGGYGGGGGGYGGGGYGGGGYGGGGYGGGGGGYGGSGYGGGEGQTGGGSYGNYASNNSYGGGNNSSYGSDGQNFSEAGGVGGSGNFQSNDAGSSAGYGDGGADEGRSYRDGDATENYADKRV